MKEKVVPDERGVAMILELLLVAVVLVLAGLAIYQSDHRPAANTAAPVAVTPSPAPSTASGEADAIAQQAEQDAATQATTSASTQTAASQVSGSDSDVSSLGGTSNASF